MQKTQYLTEIEESQKKQNRSHHAKIVKDDLIFAESPEEKIVDQEVFLKLRDKTLDFMQRFEAIFFNPGDIPMWEDRKTLSIRALAIKYHRSRFRIRDQLKRTEKKIAAIRKIVDLLANG